MLHLEPSDPEGSPELNPRHPEDFGELVRIHHRELVVYALTLTDDLSTARDLVQEAFVLAFEKIHTFDVTRDFAAWMRGIVRNKWREWIRHNRRYQLTDQELGNLDADIAAWQAHRAATGNGVLDALEQCLERLPENLHEAVMAFYYQGLTGDETSECLGIAPAAVRKRLQRARVLLKECVDRKLEN